MEGILLKYDGFFAGWAEHNCILHEDVLTVLERDTQKVQQVIHMEISKIQAV